MSHFPFPMGNASVISFFYVIAGGWEREGECVIHTQAINCKQKSSRTPSSLDYRQAGGQAAGVMLTRTWALRSAGS